MPVSQLRGGRCLPFGMRSGAGYQEENMSRVRFGRVQPYEKGPGMPSKFDFGFVSGAPSLKRKCSRHSFPRSRLRRYAVLDAPGPHLDETGRRGVAVNGFPQAAIGNECDHHVRSALCQATGSFGAAASFRKLPNCQRAVKSRHHRVAFSDRLLTTQVSRFVRLSDHSFPTYYRIPSLSRSSYSMPRNATVGSRSASEPFPGGIRQCYPEGLRCVAGLTD